MTARTGSSSTRSASFLKTLHLHFGGSVKLCMPSCADYGAFPNQVTSLRWLV